jgi:preprotein translocase subunit SecE
LLWRESAASGEISWSKGGLRMAQAAKLNREDAEHRVGGFALLSPTGKIGQYPHRLRTFLHDVRIEMKQVNWPSRADVQSTTVVVIVTVAFFALFFFMTDTLLSRAEDWLFHIVKH